MTRYESPSNRNTGEPRAYRQDYGSTGSRFWWSCSWVWRNGRREVCSAGHADSAEECRQRIAEHIAREHAGEQDGAR